MTTTTERRRPRTPNRSTLLIAAGFVVAIVVAVVVGTGQQQYDGALDPRNTDPDGAQALAEVLADEGVDVDIVRSAAAMDDVRVDESTTVLVTQTQALSPSTLQRLRERATPGRLVLVDAYRLVEEIDADLGAVKNVPADGVADCADGTGTVAGPSGIDLSGLSLDVDAVIAYTGFPLGGPATTCFPLGGTSVVLADDPSQDLVLFGAGEALSNEHILRGDNAAIALRLAGAGDRLVWYVPDPADAEADETVGLGSLLPDWIGPGIWMVGLAVIGLILWRFRRLGPLATEPLPVVVRAVETARSRGRMYRKGGDRGHAAGALRRAARADLITRLRLDRRADAATVADATARHLDVPVGTIAALLDDAQPPPASDRDLVGLAQQLTQLRNEVRGR